ncbi:hypothetical protein TSTA_120440 [Talaromyces stipitatus ATCC 10500]|uniref:F-box domain-containing protein n=1 Tax=Talaromyces stipitatus (strain ATCC 10500 / CBS 375.48 / QM 6759 / NRRL 1006) TaxID=441959 RepID=B8MDR7_TALSN|nr:uncharacterized protein TSTA_120440 [Talaromyces stipitatus ATCC 10500]EED18296.1 hypothetical protein TSTA_120440 [Talaromyces stipitatus ATCC 10500]
MLGTLPPETIRLIVESLDQIDIIVAKLAYDVQHYYRLLQRANGFWVVHRLIIEDHFTVWYHIRYKDPNGGFDQTQPWRRPGLPLQENRGPDEDILEHYLGKVCRSHGRWRYLTPLKTAHQQNHLWEPLAEFIQQLSCLESLFFASDGQFPPLRSPCLFDVEPESTYNVPGSISFSEVLNFLGTEIMPNMRLLSMRQLGTTSIDSFLSLRPPWEGFQTNPLGTSMKNFTIMNWWPTRSQIKSLKEAIDLSLLKVLKLKIALPVEALKYLAEECEFSSLTGLELVFTAFHDKLYQAGNSFLTRPPALLVLILRVWAPILRIGRVCQLHGLKLRQLFLSTILLKPVSLHNLRWITDNCPYLEELTISTSRTMGDANECAHYKALGSLPRLRRLTLSLDASSIQGRQIELPLSKAEMYPTMVGNPSFNQFDQHCAENYFPGFQLTR